MDGDKKRKVRNKSSAASSKSAAKKRKAILLTGFVTTIIIAVIVVCLIVWAIIKSIQNNQPGAIINDNSVSLEEMNAFDDLATKIGEEASTAYSGTTATFTEEGDIAAANQVFDQAIDSAERAASHNKDAESNYYVAQLKMQKMGFYVSHNLYEEAVNIGETLNPDQMPLEQRQSLYMLLALCYGGIDDDDMAAEYQEKAYAASLEVANEAGDS